jgi:hypothetical protein
MVALMIAGIVCRLELVSGSRLLETIDHESRHRHNNQDNEHHPSDSDCLRWLLKPGNRHGRAVRAPELPMAPTIQVIGGVKLSHHRISLPNIYHYFDSLSSDGQANALEVLCKLSRLLAHKQAVSSIPALPPTPKVSRPFRG